MKLPRSTGTLLQKQAVAGSDDVTRRDEANAITLHMLRNGYLEDLHAGRASPVLLDPSVSRLNNDEMKKLMIETSARLAELLSVRDRMLADEPEKYLAWVRATRMFYTAEWEREETTWRIPRRRLAFRRCRCRASLDDGWNFCPSCGLPAKRRRK